MLSHFCQLPTTTFTAFQSGSITFSSLRFVSMVVKNDPSSHSRIEIALPKLPAKFVIKKVASSEAYLFV